MNIEQQLAELEQVDPLAAANARKAIAHAMERERSRKRIRRNYQFSVGQVTRLATAAAQAGMNETAYIVHALGLGE
jgi:hypothetical protein